MSVLGPEGRAAVTAHAEERRVTYSRGPERVELAGGPVYRGAGDHADWRLALLRGLG